MSTIRLQKLFNKKDNKQNLLDRYLVKFTRTTGVKRKSFIREAVRNALIKSIHEKNLTGAMDGKDLEGDTWEVAYTKLVGMAQQLKEVK